MTVDVLSVSTLPGLFLPCLAVLLVEVAADEFGDGTGEWAFFRALDGKWMEEPAHSKCYFPSGDGLLPWVELECWGISLPIRPIIFLRLALPFPVIVPFPFLSPQNSVPSCRG